jgi:phospholipid-translocating ATPase
MICNFFYKEIIGIGVLFFFQFYCAFSTTTVYEYTLLLFWNVFWTLLPVLAMGIFDRTMDQHVIMQVPEVYRYGIENRWFGLRRFCIYMIDGIYASAVCYFFLLYTYDTTTARSDGFEVYIYEFSTVMCIIAVIIANVYNGMNTKAWNWWVLGSVLVGPVLILCYTAVYASISPGWIWTTMYGLNFFLWGSAYFWFGMLFCFFVALLPKYFMRYWNELYRATDIDILAYIAKYDPNHDFINDPMFPAARERTKYVAPGEANGDHEMQMQTLAQQGRRMTDMSGRLEPVSSRGFNFDQDPYPRRSQSSRPSSLAGLDAPANRKRSHSIKIGPVQLTMPTMKSPGTLRRKKHSNTISTLPEETDSPRGGRNRGGSNDALTQQQQDQQQTPSRSYASQVLAAQSAQNASPSRSPRRQATPPQEYQQQQSQDYYQPSSPSFSPAMRQISVDPPTDEGLLAQDRRRQQQSSPSSQPPPHTGTTPHLFVREDQR